MKIKKILIVSQYFYPENFKVNDIAFFLAEEGYDVTVLTGIPNYPKGKFYNGYGLFKKKKEIIKGVKVYRTMLTPRGNSSGVKLAFNYLSWMITASFEILCLGLQKRYDLVFVHETSPITQALPAVLLKKMQHIPMFIWVLDLWPESLQYAGGVNNKKILSFFESFTKFIYRNSSKILISSKSFEKSISNKNTSNNEIIYFPNWAEDELVKSLSLSLHNDNIFPEGFNFVFAGNIGEAQDIESIMKAAESLNIIDVNINIIGDGRKKEWAENFVLEKKLTNVFFYGQKKLEEMPVFFYNADVLLVSLKDNEIFNLTVPAKLQAYLSVKKPILGMINGEASQIINDAQCGFCVAAGDALALTDKMIYMRSMHSEDLKNMGINGFNFYETMFKKDKCLNKLVTLIKNT